MGTGVLGVDCCAPETEIDNSRIAEWTGAEPEWIEERTGVNNAGLTLDEVDRVILHQGNVRMVEWLARHLGFDPDRVEISADRYGNTAAASVPMTLALSHQSRRLQRGEVVLLACVGGGMTAGAVLIRWY
ncbi:3-oxoacyl-[acyl-carrier-protein] synthase III C-terminal domain-containing protein [Frankia sp. QA3]|uniref:3-oxoacyl-[acyl-carrier-protein] synthase III C-terminal domain-containing protein n=1 Tax=Frankia sp. QA3 TaxID=710111 RepID=UPI00055D506D|nr:3-oxoacyl-[acyl-carrier-protein] synthase III C-terminal domain-containing protein [Frankia sp. QA3]